MMRTGSCIDFSEYLEKRDQVHKAFKKFTLGAPSNPQNTSLSENSNNGKIRELRKWQGRWTIK